MYAQLILMALAATPIAAAQPQALVYRSDATCDGCPEAVCYLLQSSKYNFNVTYVGPAEDVELSAGALDGAKLFAYPGGPGKSTICVTESGETYPRIIDVHDSYEEIKDVANAVRDFIQGGGRYLGFCLGAFLAGTSPGLNILPEGIDTDSEIEQDGAQVKDSRNTKIQVNWRFSQGPNAGKTSKEKWIFFQEGVVITGMDASSNSILGTYSSNGNVSASLTPYGDGWVGLTGAHVEAPKSWCKLSAIVQHDSEASFAKRKQKEIERILTFQ